jgi:hypothetical protein
LVERTTATRFLTLGKVQNLRFRQNRKPTSINAA